jgi:hypothetical protein
VAGGAPQGNKNGSKSRMFEQALIREIKQRDIEAGEGVTLRAIAASLIEKATSGDRKSAMDIRDTLDGKPAQTITGADGGPLVVIQATAHDEAL